jgi:UDP-N-acetylmuramoyl-tripeptide--D-alanyl-D-alanine ligase
LSSRPARADLVDRVACIEVADTGQALMDAARWGRTRLPAGTMAVGVTGSVGKTTTKDLIAAAISGTKRTVASERSYNNEQGLPVTILNAPIDTEVLVLEMGMRGFGQIDLLCRIGRPAIGVVTRVGEAHTSLVGGLDGVARAKGELVEALPSFGVAVLNADDDRVIAMRSRTTARVMSYGESSAADIRIADLSLDQQGRARFTVHTPNGSTAIRLGIPGRHSASNAAAAVAVGVALGVPIEAMADGLAEARVSAHRSNALRLHSGATLLDDCYNANPTSMLAALDTLATLGSGRRLAVLGLMAELDDPAEAHGRIARRARELGVEIVAVGTDLYGVNPVEIPAAIDRLRALGSNDAALVKASRVAALERVVDAVTSP